MSAARAPELVLASTSPYRAELLARLVPRFRRVAPGVDETPLPGERSADLATRLAQAKARAVAARCAGTLVLASDQAADLHGTILGKPGCAANAVAQLTAASGQIVVFSTAVCLLDARASPPREHAAIDTTRVRFRALDADTIARYVARDLPLDCAGSFRVEALGSALFEEIESRDPSALVGLPLIAVARLLRAAGVEVI